MADQETQEQLREDLGTLQEDWDELQNLLGRRTELTQTIIEVGEHLLLLKTGDRYRTQDQGWGPVPDPGPLKFLY